MKKILLSVSIIAAVAAVVFGVTTAFFSDTETSEGNTFTAGAIDLKVDSECHYWNYVGNVDGADGDGYIDVGCKDAAGVAFGDWSERDLKDGVYKFFSFFDLKPGDRGEDTISLHVYDNDAWGMVRWLITDNGDNDCTEPELEAEPDCANNPDEGELYEAMEHTIWLDQGSIPGFQCVNADGNPIEDCEDDEEGDNIQQAHEPVILSGEEFGRLREGYELSEVLASAYANKDGEDSCSDLGGNVDGHNDYDVCHGLAKDGRMVGSTTYYFGVAWELPFETGNAVQTDSFGGDISFIVEQHRNNPVPFD